jgi:hypothetical protein
MSSEETSVPFPKDVQRDSEHTNRNLHARNTLENVGYTSLLQPIIARPRQTEREDIFKDHHASEGFDGDVAWNNISFSFCVGQDEAREGGLARRRAKFLRKTYDERLRHITMKQQPQQPCLLLQEQRRSQAKTIHSDKYSRL